jgi:hypothetical protein
LNTFTVMPSYWDFYLLEEPLPFFYESQFLPAIFETDMRKNKWKLTYNHFIFHLSKFQQVSLSFLHLTDIYRANLHFHIQWQQYVAWWDWQYVKPILAFKNQINSAGTMLLIKICKAQIILRNADSQWTRLKPIIVIFQNILSQQRNIPSIKINTVNTRPTWGLGSSRRCFL